MLSLRPAKAEDENFLFQVYESTRSLELSYMALNPAQKQQFLQMQYKSQRGSYQNQCPDAEYQVIELDEVPIGRLIVERNQEAIHLVDISLLTHYRNLGHGSSLIRKLQDEARVTGKPRRLYVEKMSPARSLYERMGFRTTRTKDFYLSMEWLPFVAVSHA